jgi:hypothetical protein
MARSLEHRLQRLEAAAGDDEYQIIVVWDDENPEPTPGRHIRLSWRDNNEGLRDAPATP